MKLLIAAAALAATPTLAEQRAIYSEIPAIKANQDRIGWADAVIAGDTVYVSGVIAFTKPGETGFEPAYERAFQRLGKTLQRAGVEWADVVEVRSYHTDVNAQIDAIAKVKRRYRPAPDPAWTAVGTSGLLHPSGITEIALVAKLPGARK